jgi:divalent metal cation (Fe/Co/Zn/Cd) transporter
MGDDDNDFEERFALRVKPDTRLKQMRFLKPEVAQKLKAIKRDMKTNIISPDQFNNKKQKQNKEKKNDR